MAQRSRIHALLLLIVLAGSLTLALQRWVGGATLYQESQSGRREVFHKAILQNRIPPPYTSWQQVGAIRVNIRIATVYLAESVHRLTNLNVLKVYELIDTLALFFSFLLLLGPCFATLLDCAHHAASLTTPHRLYGPAGYQHHRQIRYDRSARSPFLSEHNSRELDAHCLEVNCDVRSSLGRI